MAECVESACLVIQFMNEFIRPIRLQLDIYKEREQNKRLLAFAVTGLSWTVNQMERDLYYNAGNKKERERKKKVNDQKEPKPQVHNRNENIAYTSREVNTSGAIPTKKKKKS